MVVRKILKYGDEILRERAKEVHKVSRKITSLVDDLLDTMYAQNGVGLAAPQIGVGYRVFVVDVSMGKEPPRPFVFINPKIIKKSGAIISNEGCLSFPDLYTDVKRYKNIVIKAQDMHGKTFILEAKNGDLLSRAIQHEFDHLDGILFIDHCFNRFEMDNLLAECHLPAIQPEKLLQEPELEKELNG